MARGTLAALAMTPLVDGALVRIRDGGKYDGRPGHVVRRALDGTHLYWIVTTATMADVWAGVLVGDEVTLCVHRVNLEPIHG